jgi:hypothetical protein
VSEGRSSLVTDYRPRIPRAAAVTAARERMAQLEPGGKPSSPIDVESASQVEIRALSMPCLRCDGPYRLDEHTAELVEGRRVRTVAMHCGHCGARRVLYFRVLASTAS